MSRDKLPWQIPLPGDRPRTPPRSPPRTPPPAPPSTSKASKSGKKKQPSTPTGSSGDESMDELLTPRAPAPATPVKSREDVAIDDVLTPSMAALKTPSKASKSVDKKRAIEADDHSEDELASDGDTDRTKEAWKSLFKPAGSGATTTSQTASSKKGQASSSKKGQASSKKVKSGTLASFFGTASSPPAASSASSSSAPAAQKKSKVPPTIAPAPSPADAGPSTSSSASSSFVPLTSSSSSTRATSSSSTLPSIAGPSTLPSLAGPSTLPSLAGPSTLPSLAGPSTLPSLAGPSTLPSLAGSSTGARPTPRMDRRHMQRLQAAGKPVERQIEPKKEIGQKQIVAIKDQHPTLTWNFVALRDIPLLSNPFEPSLYIWNYAAKFSQLCSDDDLWRSYQRMLALLQLVRIAASGETVETWLDRFDQWIGPRTCQKNWCPLIESLPQRKIMHDNDKAPKVRLFRSIFRGLNATQILTRFTSMYAQETLHPSVWQVVEAASAFAAGTGPPIPSPPAFPPTLFPNEVNRTAFPIDVDACEEHFEARLPAFFTACKHFGVKGISGNYGDLQVTHLLNTVLLDDIKKPGLQALQTLPNSARCEALLARANLPPDHGPVAKEDIFTSDQLKTLKANSKARSEKLAAEATFANAQHKATTKKPRTHLLAICRSAALRDGFQLRSTAYESKVVELFAHHRYTTRGEHSCDYCSHAVTAVALSHEGLRRRKAAGIKGRANFVWNLSLDRRTPARLGGAYRLKPENNVAKSCKGCNETKSGFPEENFLVLLGEIKQHALTELDAKGFLSPSPPPYREVNQVEHNFISGWVSNRIASLRSNHQGTWKEGDLDYDQLYDEVRIWYAGDGCVIDGASGLKLPLHLMQIDRKYPDQPYRRAIIRLLFGPFNINRNDAPDDTPLAEHFSGVRETFDLRRSLAMRAEGHGLPGMRTAARLARGECRLDDKEVAADVEAAEEARKELARLEAAAVQASGSDSEEEEDE